MNDDVTRSLCIAHGGDLSEPSGGTVRITAFAAGLQERGIDITLVVPCPEGDLPEKLSDISVVEVPVKTRGTIDQPIRALRIAWKARQVADERNARLQIEQSTLGGVANMAGISDYVLDMHDLVYPSPQYGDLPFNRGIQQVINRLEEYGLRKAEKVIVVSEQMRCIAINQWGIPEERFVVIPNAYFKEAVEPFRDTEPVAGRIVFLGTLHHKIDVHAFVQIAQMDEIEELVIVGDGPQYDELDAARQTHGLTKLRLTGRLPDSQAYELLASADIAINPQRNSRHQEASCPVKFYYYAALGRPMITTAGPSLAEQLAAEQAAIVVDSNEKFPDRIRELLADDQKKRHLAANARQFVETETWESRVETLLTLYQ